MDIFYKREAVAAVERRRKAPVSVILSALSTARRSVHA
jgi:hypothetical protein